VAFVTSTETELFAVRCGINQACSKENISKIIVITDSIHMVKKIFDTKSHPYQIHTAAILNELRQFFTTCQGNHIEFWDALVNSGGDFTNPLTETRNRSSPYPYSQVKFLGTIAKKITTSKCGG